MQKGNYRLQGSRIIEKKFDGTMSGGQKHYVWKTIIDCENERLAAICFNAITK